MPEDIKKKRIESEDSVIADNKEGENSSEKSPQHRNDLGNHVDSSSVSSSESEEGELQDDEGDQDEERSTDESRRRSRSRSERRVRSRSSSASSSSSARSSSRSPSPKPRKEGRDRDKEKDDRRDDRKRRRSPSTESDKEEHSTREKEKRSESKGSSRTPAKKRSKSGKDRRSRSHSRDTKQRRKRSRSSSGERSKHSRRSGRKDSRKRDGKRKAEEEDATTEKDPSPVVKREPTARELEIARLLKEEEEGKDEKEVDVEPVWSLKKAQVEKPSRQCPYLDTIDRGALDFDFEKLCSVSLSHVNVYACMVCGKYFQGRGTNTHAYTHSLDTNHRVYLNLVTLKFYCLPDNYEIIDPSLDDIKYVLKPTYTKKYIKGIDKTAKMSRAFDDTTYHPGVVGLNNIKANDYENVVLHALSHVPPLRDYFLREENYAGIKRPPGDKLCLLSKRFGELIRKLWNPKAFKAHVSPHEMLQAIVLCSNKKFQITKQGDAAEFLNFFLNTLHMALNGTQKTSSSIIYRIFRGRMRVFTRKVIPVETAEESRKTLLESDEFKEKMKEIPFLYLTLDLPAAPLYRDELLQNIIPQVPLSALLTKFNGVIEREYKTYSENFMKRFVLVRLPPYLIITYKRFQKNQWFIEKNPTIVNFPISNVDLYDCLSPESRESHKYTTYDLVSNIVHDGQPESGSYRVQLFHGGAQKWYELEDLHVKEILPQMITLAESYIQIWRLNTTKTREQRTGEIGEDGAGTPASEPMEQ